ncbi:hypothetical protein BaRGS_00024431 [Batillaria attramentaria]|uniref:Uncharacterized protein n=1 Tax=Batillaria attramentaria TaxID=370345 RepID=A0ABD0KB26_9CAEN
MCLCNKYLRTTLSGQSCDFPLDIVVCLFSADAHKSDTCRPVLNGFISKATRTGDGRQGALKEGKHGHRNRIMAGGSNETEEKTRP